MTHRLITAPQLVEYAKALNRPGPDGRLIYALASRLEQEYQRANRHRDKTLDLAIAKSKLAEYEHSRTGYIKVAKPHIQLVSSSGFGWPAGRPIWRCTGSFGSVQFGNTPSAAYAAWRKVMEQGHGIPRKHSTARFRFNHMRKG